MHYLCSVHFEKSKTKADNNRKVPGIWSQKKRSLALRIWEKVISFVPAKQEIHNNE